MDLGQYIDRYADFSLSSNWAVIKDGKQYVIGMPNTQKVATGLEMWDWGRNFTSDEFSSKLWYQSLQWLPALWFQHGDEHAVADGLKNYADWITPIANQQGYAPFNSQDHAHALQLRAASAILAVATTQKVPAVDYSELQNAALHYFEQVSSFVFDSKYMKPNNHGLMVAKAMVEAGFVLRNIGADNLHDIADKYTSAGLEGISFVVSEVFDSQGLVSENTPYYQGLYVGLMRNVISFLKETNTASPKVQEWENLIELGAETWKKILWNDGSNPPIGDDWGQPSNVNASQGVVFSRENGLFAYSDEHTEFSVICGSKGFVHKQADDTSIRLRFKGIDLIMDSGLLSYDMKDPIAYTMFGQKAHSGLYFRRFDKLRGPELYWANVGRMKADIGHEESGTESHRVFCQATIDQEWKVRREVSFAPSELIIEDSFDCPDLLESPVARFVFHESSSIAMEKSRILVRRSGTWLLLTLPEGARISAPVFYRDGQPIGWRARRYYDEVPTHVVEVEFPAGQKVMSTRVQWGSDSDALWEIVRGFGEHLFHMIGSTKSV